MNRVLLIFLAGCNQVFGLQDTTEAPPIDARQFDAPPDAPYACPPAGSGEPPTFAAQFHQIVPRGNCRSYTTSPMTGVAIATCVVTAGPVTNEIRHGAIDSDLLTPSVLTPPFNSGFSLPKLSPEGDQLWTAYLDASSSMWKIAVYTPDGSDGWTRSVNVSSHSETIEVVSTPMRAGRPRRVLYATTTEIRELDEGSNGIWTEIVDHRYRVPGGTAASPNLSPDGLRMVFMAVSGPLGSPEVVHYADRPNLSAPFGPAIPLVDVPAGADTPFLTDNCGRLYFSGLGSVLYVAQ